MVERVIKCNVNSVKVGRCISVLDAATEPDKIPQTADACPRSRSCMARLTSEGWDGSASS
jgi:hypothetical protein